MAKKKVTRVQDIVPDAVLQLMELQNSQYPNWLRIVLQPDSNEYLTQICAPVVRGLRRVCDNGTDLSGLFALSQWLHNGPKIVRVTDEQHESLSNVSIDLELKDYTQPFPTLFVEVCNPVFRGVLLYRYSEEVLCLHLMSYDHSQDIVTNIRQKEGRNIESFLNIVADDCEDLLVHSIACQRVGLNMCLALTNFGYESSPAYPKVLADDKALSSRTDESGENARRRVRNALHDVRFTRDVVIRRTAPTGPCNPNATGARVAPHWVRGHWKMQSHGPKNALRKRILIAPYLVHADEVVRPITTVYEDRR